MAQTTAIYLLTLLEAEKSRVEVPTGLVFWRGCSSWLLLCSVTVKRDFSLPLFIGPQCQWIRASPLWPNLTWINSWRSCLQGRVILGVRVSTCAFWGHTIQPIAKAKLSWERISLMRQWVVPSPQRPWVLASGVSLPSYYWSRCLLIRERKSDVRTLSSAYKITFICITVELELVSVIRFSLWGMGKWNREETWVLGPLQYVLKAEG